VADGWCWFVLREKYCWLIVGGWFVVREKYCWLVADKPSEQAGHPSPPRLDGAALRRRRWWEEKPTRQSSINHTEPPDRLRLTSNNAVRIIFLD
jgi:hypothetical protein